MGGVTDETGTVTDDETVTKVLLTEWVGVTDDETSHQVLEWVV